LDIFRLFNAWAYRRLYADLAKEARFGLAGRLPDCYQNDYWDRSV
jgi:hypothetical protein